MQEKIAALKAQIALMESRRMRDIMGFSEADYVDAVIEELYRQLRALEGTDNDR